MKWWQRAGMKMIALVTNRRLYVKAFLACCLIDAIFQAMSEVLFACNATRPSVHLCCTQLLGSVPVCPVEFNRRQTHLNAL